MKTLWKYVRSTPYYVYSMDTLTLFTTCLGQAHLAEMLGVHVNTARRAIAAQVYQGYVISLSLLTPEAVQAIIASISTTINTRIVKRIYIYNASKTVLLHTYDSVNAFMQASGLNGSGVRSLALSSTAL